MLKEYSNEQFWELYKKLPQELKDTLFDEGTSNNIVKACKRNGIKENLGLIVDCVGQVLLGVLPLDNFTETLETELKIDKETAEKISREIHRFIFYPVKGALEDIYKIKISAGAEEHPPSAEKTAHHSDKDAYRESLE